LCIVQIATISDSSLTV